MEAWSTGSQPSLCAKIDAANVAWQHKPRRLSCDGVGYATSNNTSQSRKRRSRRFHLTFSLTIVYYNDVLFKSTATGSERKAFKMPGEEINTVVGLIASIITIVETSKPSTMPLKTPKGSTKRFVTLRRTCRSCLTFYVTVKLSSSK